MNDAPPITPKPQVTVQIDCETYGRLHAYVRSTPGELTLLATAEPDLERNQIRVRQLFLPHQVSTSCHTQVSEEALAQLLVEAVQAQVDVASLKVWLHSHGSMAVFFSTIDDQNIRNAFPQSPWVLSIVVNRAGDIKARLSLFSPFRIDLDDLPVIVGLPSNQEEIIRQEVLAKVRQGLTSSAGSSSTLAQAPENGPKPAEMLPNPGCTYLIATGGKATL